jgi:hypothetical protein
MADDLPDDCSATITLITAQRTALGRQMTDELRNNLVPIVEAMLGGGRTGAEVADDLKLLVSYVPDTVSIGNATRNVVPNAKKRRRCAALTGNDRYTDEQSERSQKCKWRRTCKKDGSLVGKDINEEWHKYVASLGPKAASPTETKKQLPKQLPKRAPTVPEYVDHYAAASDAAWRRVHRMPILPSEY